MREVIALDGLSREAWLAARRAGIGSSDAAAIMGLDKWRSAFDIYVEKISDEPDDRSSNLLMRLGNYLEDGVAQAYSEETGSTVTKPTHMYAHDDYPWMLANVDRFTDGGGDLGVLEVKTAHRYDDWEDGAPEQYQIQCLHQLGVTGLPYADLVALLGGREMRYFRFERSDYVETIDGLIEIEMAFWEQVQRREPPPVDARSGESLKRLYRDAVDLSVELDDETFETYCDWLIAKQRTKEAEERERLLGNRLRAALGEATVGTYEGTPLVSWDRQLRMSLNRQALEADHPTLVNEYLRKTPVRTLRPKRKIR